MPQRQVVFVHHEQGSGQLSRDNAIKVWTHVSQQSSQKPKHKTFVKWRPPRATLEVQKVSASDNDEIVVAVNKLRHLYAAKKGLQPIQSPETLYRLETSIFIAYDYCQRSLLPQSAGAVGAVHFQISLSIVQTSIQLGVDSLLEQNYSRAFALFEYAARRLQTCIAEPTMDRLGSVFCTFVNAIIYAQKRNAQDVARLFLQQFLGLATVAGGTTHSLVVLAKDWLSCGVTPELAIGLNRACFVTTFDDSYLEFLMFMFKCEVLEVEYSMQEACYTYGQLTNALDFSKDDDREKFQTLNAYMARIYLWNHQYEEAERIVSDAPDDLATWIETAGWEVTSARIAHISITMLVLRLTCLAQALAGQGRDDSADAIFRSCMFATQRLNNPQHHTTVKIEAQRAYSAFLINRGRKSDAESIESTIDTQLQDYVLDLPVSMEE